MPEFEASLLDGRTARQRRVIVAVLPFGLELRFLDSAPHVQWFWREVGQRRPEFPADPVVFEHARGEMLTVNDGSILAEILRVAPGARLAGEGSLIARRLKRLALIALLVVPFTVYGVWKVLPWLSERLATLIPPAVEERMGDSVARYLSRKGDLCQNRATLDAVDRIVQRLHAAGGPSPYRMRLRVVRNNMVNAFAAPGGHIMVFQGLLQMTSNEDELAGVLAHEIIHVRRRHTTKAIFRQMGIWAGLAVLTGDISGALATVAGTAGILRFMREHETEADLAGLELMRQAGYNVAGMGTIFRKLQDVTGNMPGLLEFLSTHPDTAERIKAIDRAAGAATPKHVSAAAEADWQPVREGCAAL